jgi:hypothetical protein
VTLADWTYNGLLSTTRCPNGNQVGATCTWIGLEQLPHPNMWMALLLRRGEAGLWYTDALRARETLCKIDDYIAIVAANPDFAQEVTARLEDKFGFLAEPGQWDLSRWFYRFPGFVAHAYFSARTRPSAFLRLAWSISMVISALKPVSNQDAWMQSALMLHVYWRSGKTTALCTLAGRFWRSRLPKTVSEICADYIGTADHPLVEAWKERIP